MREIVCLLALLAAAPAGAVTRLRLNGQAARLGSAAAAGASAAARPGAGLSVSPALGTLLPASLIPQVEARPEARAAALVAPPHPTLSPRFAEGEETKANNATILGAILGSDPHKLHKLGENEERRERLRNFSKEAGQLDESVDSFTTEPGGAGLELDRLFAGVTLKDSYFGSPGLRVEGEKPQFLGGGNFGSVYRSPKRPGRVYKLLNPSVDLFLFSNVTMRQVIDEEDAVSRAISEAGVGPAYYGRRRLGRYFVYSKEEISGKTVARLVEERRFHEEERALVLELLDRMADARLRVDDMRLVNIMIGTRPGDSARKAYLIDGTQELVFGERAGGKLRRGVLGAPERALIDALFARYGEPPLSSDEDPRLERIMIGETHRDKRRLARYVDADGHLPLAPEPAVSRDEHRRFLEEQLIVKKVMGNPMAGTNEELLVPFAALLDEGVARSKQTGWQKVWAFLGEILSSYQPPVR